MLEMNDSIDPIIPLTEDQQKYQKLIETERKRFEEHASRVNQANQVRRNNERQQFQERMQKCPVGLPQKRMSPRTPPPLSNNDFKFPTLSTNSPHHVQQWIPNEQATLNKNSSDPMSNQINNATLTPHLINQQQQLYAQQINYQQSYLSSTRLNHYQPYHYPQKQQNNLQYAQFLQQTQSNMAGAQRALQFQQMDYTHQQRELTRIQMMHYQQQLAKNQLGDTKSSVPIVSEALNPMNYWSSTTQQFRPNMQFPSTPNQSTFNASNHNLSTNNPYNPMTTLNFMPSTGQQVTVIKDMPTQPMTKLTTKNQEKNGKEQSKNVNGLKINLSGTKESEEDDMLALFSTLEEDSMEHNQMMEQYLDNIPDIQTCNFAQIPTNATMLPVDQRSTLNSSRVN